MKLLSQSAIILNNVLISIEKYVLNLRCNGPSAPHDDTGGIKIIPPCLLYLGIPWRLVVSLMLHPFLTVKNFPVPFA